MNRKILSVAIVLLSVTAISAFADPTKDSQPPVKKAEVTEHVYAVIVGSDNCPACKSMYNDIRKLRAEGYEIYYEDAGSAWCKANGIVRCPVPAIVVLRGAVRLSLKIGALPLKALTGHLNTLHVRVVRPRLN